MSKQVLTDQDAGVQSGAAERIEDAFWELLAEMPAEKISVSKLVERADVNRNSFYYHYENIEEFTEAVVGKVPSKDIALIILDVLNGKRELSRELITEADIAVRFAKIRLATGHHASRRMCSILKEQLLRIWISILSERSIEATKEKLMLMEFMMAGIFEIMQNNDFQEIVSNKHYVQFASNVVKIIFEGE